MRYPLRDNVSFEDFTHVNSSTEDILHIGRSLVMHIFPPCLRGNFLQGYGSSGVKDQTQNLFTTNHGGPIFKSRLMHLR
jgi:hypothetical protein